MLFSYLSLTFRNLLTRRPVYNGVNILGLCFGLTIAGLTALYIHHEITYDSFHPKADQTYRISAQHSDTWFASLSIRHSNALYENQFPEVEKTVRMRRWPPKYIRYENELFYERKVYFTDSGSDFFDLFNFTSVEGDLKSSLSRPNSVVLTRSIAASIFGDERAIGKDLAFDTLQLKVTAVIEDLPSSSHMDFKVLITNDQAMARASGHFTYCALTRDADLDLLRKKIMAVPAPSNEFSALQDCRIIPLRDLHFEGNLTYEMKPPGSKLYLLVFTLIGSAILLLSCFNFINLSVAIYAQRTKEIAIRKMAGASRKHLSAQFIIESLCTAVIGFPFILVFVQFLLPPFNELMAIRLQNLFVTQAGACALLFVLTILVGLVSGVYPALVLPRISSLALFKTGKLTGFGSLNLRTVLVTVQLTVMIVMLIGSSIIKSQMDFLSEKDLGFEREGVVKLKGAWSIDSLQFSRIKNKLLTHPAVSSVSQGFVPGDEEYGTLFKGEGSEVVQEGLIAFATDADYIGTLGLQIIKLQEGISLENSQTKAVLINETLAKRLGYSDPIGRTITLDPGKKYEGTRVIKGVFRDFHFFSLHQPIAPMMLSLRPFGSGINESILVKLNMKNLEGSLEYINTVVKEVAPDVPLTTEFLDDSLAMLYEKEQKLSFFSSVLLCVTVFLSALGLVGLSSFMAAQKTKEIGIRKVLGAQIGSLIRLVSKPFVKLALIAFVIGASVSSYLMERWLQGFVYSVSISWHFYVYALGGLLLLLLLTVGSHAIKASLADPVKSLRSE